MGECCLILVAKGCVREGTSTRLCMLRNGSAEGIIAEVLLWV